ncbi:hypothetical protein PCL_10184 [Purpureocillium lilacinum]|uniref:Rieske domain-containing protein n=1 Tax=Purpureocillium lilacinum TaxID=33203 RepID=A0A2U3EF74_PURLI|nr:hypothetical protein PCL_10184 [Purpureocillium lilacinum]
MSRWFALSKGISKGHKQPRPARALPPSWYRSSAMYELERRAIFSNRWLLVSHKARFVSPGDFVRIIEAGFSFFLIRDREGQIRAHHNVCRHRAYPLVEKNSGQLSTLACKYHGWSYGFDGRLAKAPKYQELSGFDQSANNLFAIHVHVDKLGFIWVNLDSSSKPVISWKDDFAGVDEQTRLQDFNLDNYHFDHQWEMEGDYNWKTLADNYNEYWVETTGGYIQHFNVDKPEKEGMGICSTFYYPNASMTISDFNGIWDCFKQILKEDKDLCNAVQVNLNAGIFLTGELHPRVEKGPVFFQTMTRKLVTGHSEQEGEAGKEIWLATPQYNMTIKSQKEMDFCDGLERAACLSGSPEFQW